MINVSSIHNGSFPDFLYWDSIAVQPRSNNDDYVYTYDDGGDDGESS